MEEIEPCLCKLRVKRFWIARAVYGWFCDPVKGMDRWLSWMNAPRLTYVSFVLQVYVRQLSE